MFGPEGPSLRELCIEALSSTRDGYDRLAPWFDATPFRTPDAVLERATAHLADGPRLSAALDLCCGTGAALGHLAAHCDRLVGVDFSEGMLARARDRLAPLGPRLELVHADVSTWEPEPGAFDLVTCFGAFGHLVRPRQPAFLEKVRRALRPGGRFLYVTAPPPGPTDRAFWLAHGFNAVMRVRNRLIRPPFVMFYLNFTLDESLARVREAGLVPEVRPLGWDVRPDAVVVEAFNPR